MKYTLALLADSLRIEDFGQVEIGAGGKLGISHSLLRESDCPDQTLKARIGA